MSSLEDLRAAFLAGHDRGSRYNEGWAEQNRQRDWLAWSQTLEPARPADELAVVPLAALRALIEAVFSMDLDMLLATHMAEGEEADAWRAEVRDRIRALGVPELGDLE